MLRVKLGGIEYHFLSLWYDSTWDWTLVSQAIGKHSTHRPLVVNFLSVPEIDVQGQLKNTRFFILIFKTSRHICFTIKINVAEFSIYSYLLIFWVDGYVTWYRHMSKQGCTKDSCSRNKSLFFKKPMLSLRNANPNAAWNQYRRRICNKKDENNVKLP